MTKNIVDEIIDKQDIETLNQMAKKYKMSFLEFARFIAKIDQKAVKFQIRLSEEEVRLIDESAKMLNLSRGKYVSRGKYCSSAYKWFIENELDKNIVIPEIIELSNDRNIKISISFNNNEEFENITASAKKYSMPISTFIRYCALRYANFMSKSK